MEFLIAKVNKFREFLKEKSQRNVWESVLAKIPGIFGLFATARFYNSKGNRRCAGCRFVRDAVGAQISIKKSRNFMRNGWGKPPMEIPHTFFEGEDVFMKGKMHLWRGRCIYEGEDVFIKGKMYLWRGRCIYKGEDVFMKGKMYSWRGRCVYEGEDVFMKGKMYLWRKDKFIKGATNSWNFWRNWK